MKITAQPGVADAPLNFEGDPDTSYILTFQDTALQRVTRRTVTTDSSGKAVATPPVAFGLGPWAVAVDTPDGKVFLVGTELSDGNFTMVDPADLAKDAGTGSAAAQESDAQRATAAHAGSTYTPSE